MSISGNASLPSQNSDTDMYRSLKHPKDAIGFTCVLKFGFQYFYLYQKLFVDWVCSHLGFWLALISNLKVTYCN